MRCYSVIVHGRLDWNRAVSGDDDDPFHPEGFYCHRFVLASGPETAMEQAFRRVRDHLDKQTGWLSGGYASLHLEVDEIGMAPVRKLLAAENRAHIFYEDD